jgi:hypothetical protein
LLRPVFLRKDAARIQTPWIQKSIYLDSNKSSAYFTARLHFISLSAKFFSPVSLKFLRRVLPVKRQIFSRANSVLAGYRTYKYIKKCKYATRKYYDSHFALFLDLSSS